MPAGSDPPILEYAVPIPKPRHRLRAVVLTVLGIFALLFLFAILLPTRQRPRVEPNRVRSASKLREIGQAIVLYCNDHGGVYPDSFQTILLEGYFGSEVFVSPLGSDTPATGPTTQAIADQLIAGGHLSYVYLGRGLTTQTATGDTIVVDDNSKLKVKS